MWHTRETVNVVVLCLSLLLTADSVYSVRLSVSYMNADNVTYNRFTDMNDYLYNSIVSTLCSSDTSKYELSPQQPTGYTETHQNPTEPTNGTLFYECHASSTDILSCSNTHIITDCTNYGRIFPLDTNTIASCTDICVLILWSHDQDANITMVPEPSDGLNSTTCFNPCLIIPTLNPIDSQNTSDTSSLQTTETTNVPETSSKNSAQISVKQDSDDHTSLIIAVTISGGMALILLIVIVVFICFKRRYPDQEQPLNESSASTDENNDNKNEDIHFTQDDVAYKDNKDGGLSQQNVYHVNVAADVTHGRDDVSESLSSSPVMTSMYGVDEISAADDVVDDGSAQVRL
ncbi:uncharacterized protein LOC131953052 [Physella acuta]|uniref:uncharacterized protein LOC131953052 n=1 Tax=Physella acuta TaxID=109671 RepID=UPI0027DE13CC|nr:uncharacterized protein LOC131953052 [Physella acuta]